MLGAAWAGLAALDVLGGEPLAGRAGPAALAAGVLKSSLLVVGVLGAASVTVGCLPCAAAGPVVAGQCPHLGYGRMYYSCQLHEVPLLRHTWSKNILY